MKPINLKISGINSYNKPQTINFKRLSAGNLFGIFGATGSGKSTILDSVIIALYGISGDRGKSAGIINVNLKDAEIVFEFELEEEGLTCLYEVTRKFKVRPSGFKSEAYLINKNTKEILGDTTDKVNATIIKLLGINKPEFIKCVALPQNEFDKFLLDTPADRKKSIAKLFNLEKFGEHLNKKLKERKDGLEKEEATLQAKLNIFGDLSVEKQKDLQTEIKKLSVKIKDFELEANELGNKVKQLEVVYEKRQQLKQSEEGLEQINLQKSHYEKLKADLENYEKSREQLIAYNNYMANVAKLDDIKFNQKTAEIELKNKSLALQEILVDLNNLRQQDKLLNTKQKSFEIAFEKNKLLKLQINEVSESLLELEKAYKKTFEKQKDLLAKESDAGVQYDKAGIDVKKATSLVEENEKLLEQANAIVVISENEKFVSQLLEVKNCFNEQNVLEVKQFKVYAEIRRALEVINKADISLKANLKERDSLVKSLKTSVLDVSQLAIEQKTAKDNLKKLEGELSKANINKTAISYELQGVYKELGKLKNETLQLNEKLKELKAGEQLTLKDCSSQIISNSKQIEEKEQREKLHSTKISELEKNLDIYKVKIDYITKENNGFKSRFPKDFTSEMLSNINEDNFTTMQEELKEYNKNKDYYENRIRILTKELAGKEVVDVVPHKERLAKLNELLNEHKVDLGIKEALYKENAKKLSEQKDVVASYKKVSKDLEIVLNLHSLLSQNALVHFVSEEYLHLISQYANEFIKKITRGKFMLKYISDNSGEFIVVDNFNAGAERSIKSLSGGERFIFSLGLALGVSQSIAINNNRQFNFFFIDEGFGSLSEDFVDDILQCFDSLIKLDFTIGFISHVEKMKEYINNKVIVTKNSIDEGSVITEYF